MILYDLHGLDGIFFSDDVWYSLFSVRLWNVPTSSLMVSEDSSDNEAKVSGSLFICLIVAVWVA